MGDWVKHENRASVEKYWSSLKVQDAAKNRQASATAWVMKSIVPLRMRELRDTVEVVIT